MSFCWISSTVYKLIEKGNGRKKWGVRGGEEGGGEGGKL